MVTGVSDRFQLTKSAQVTTDPFNMMLISYLDMGSLCRMEKWTDGAEASM